LTYKKNIILVVLFILTLLVVSDVKEAYSLPLSNLDPISTLISSSNSNTKTINDAVTNTSSPQKENFQAQQSFYQFLNEVVDINTSNYIVTNFMVSSSKVLNSQKTQTAISAILLNKQESQENLSVAMALIEGKVKFYDLGSLSGTIKGSELNISNCLANTKRAISSYQTNFNANYSNEFVSILPNSVNSLNTTLNSDNLTVSIQVFDQAKTPLKYMTIFWYERIDNITIKQLSVQSTISKTGVITSFADNMGIYEVATSNISVTKEAAIRTAMPYIEEYATANNRKIESINATLSYVRDLNESRGDNTLIYPQWCVAALFDKSPKEIFGFDVMVWADNGIVNSDIAQGRYRPMPSNSRYANYYIFMAVESITFIVIILCVGIKRKIYQKRTLNPKLMIFAAVIITVLLSAQFMIKPGHAIPASIIATTLVDEDELVRVNDLESAVNSWCQDVGYQTYYWYGSDVTASHMYIAAYDHGESGSFVDNIGHGYADWLAYWFEGYQYYPQRYLVDKDDNGVYDCDIYDNSYDLSIGHHKVCVFWTCTAADFVGGIEYIPGHGYIAHGMPFA
jgi:hypothetical protein